MMLLLSLLLLLLLLFLNLFQSIVEQEKLFAKEACKSKDARQVRSIEESVKNLFDNRMNQIVCDANNHVIVEPQLLFNHSRRDETSSKRLLNTHAMLATQDRRTSFWFHNAMVQTLVDDEIPYDVSRIKRNFREIDSIDEFWMWLEGPFLDQFYPQVEPVYVADNGTQNGLRGYVGGQSRIVGVPRIRQLRSMRESCDLPDQVAMEGEVCFSEAGCIIPKIRCTEGIEQGTQVFGGVEYAYQTPNDLDSGVSLTWGQFSRWYPVSGYVQNFPSPWYNSSYSNATALIAALKASDWIDHLTRVVNVEFSLINTHTNDYMSGIMMVEYPLVGGAITSFDFNVGRFVHYQNGNGLIALEIVVSIGFFCYLISELEAFSLLGTCKYLSTMSHLLMFLMLVIWMLLIIMYIYIINYENSVDWTARDEYVPIIRLALGVRATTYLLSFLIAFAWWNLLNYLTIIKAFAELLVMIEFMLLALYPLLLLLLFVLCSFAFAMYVAFGYQDIDSQTFWVSLATRVRDIAAENKRNPIMLYACEHVVETFGGVDYERIAGYDRVIGTFWSVAFVIFLGVLILNLIIAVLTHQYESAREQVGKRHWAHYQYKSIMFHWIVKKERKDYINTMLSRLCCSKKGDDGNGGNADRRNNVTDESDAEFGCLARCKRGWKSCISCLEETISALINGVRKIFTKCHNCWIIPASKQYMQHVMDLEVKAKLSKLKKHVRVEQGVALSMHRLPSMSTVPEYENTCCGCKKSCYQFWEWCKHLCRCCGGNSNKADDIFVHDHLDEMCPLYDDEEAVVGHFADGEITASNWLDTLQE
eukprot:jgi/Bigna1/80484/fgenesh1_pg.71_\